MTKSTMSPMAPEAKAKEHKLCWLQVAEAIEIIRKVLTNKSWSKGEYGIIRIRNTCDDPTDPSSNHDFGYSKGLDLEGALKEYKSGMKATGKLDMDRKTR